MSALTSSCGRAADETEDEQPAKFGMQLWNCQLSVEDVLVGKKVPVTQAYAQARLQFFPGARNQRRVWTKVSYQYQPMLAVVMSGRLSSYTLEGVKAQAILASLAFRAWALAVAEAKRQVAELSCSAGKGGFLD
ncbi:unnamed protein product, partial [Symbiodinium microadriaticum]